MLGTTSSRISDQLRDIYSIFRCYWNVATYKWKVHNRKIKMYGIYVLLINLYLVLYLQISVLIKLMEFILTRLIVPAITHVQVA